MIKFLQKELTGFTVSLIKPEDFERAARIYAANKEFCADNCPQKSVTNDSAALPSSAESFQKLYALVSEKGQDIAVLDLICGYPLPKSLWIGLLLLDSRLQGKGLGTKIATAILRSAKSDGYESVSLGVQKTHPKALVFWQGLGFTYARETTTVTVLKKAFV